MKGILLSGGLGTRLFPLTKVVSKQLLPLYNKPLVYYPLSTLMLSGIREVLVISSERDLPLFKSLLGDGSYLGMSFTYAVQKKPLGIAESLIIAEDFLAGQSAALILGDNFFYGQGFSEILKKSVQKIESKESTAVLFGCAVQTPEAYGVLSFDTDGVPTYITEKPIVPQSDYAVAGLYFYDSNASYFAKQLVPSKRGELEITDLNNIYLTSGTASVELLGRGFTWLDCGTSERLLEASNFVCALEKRHGRFCGCIEEIAFQNGWISAKELNELAALYNCEYGLYLLNMAKKGSSNGFY